MRTLKRVRRMTPGETLYRLVERARSELERIGTRLGLADNSARSAARRRSARHLPFSGTTRHGRSFLGDLHSGPALRFYFNPADRLPVFHFIAREFPGWIEAAEQDGVRLAQHKLDLLGYGEVDLGPEIDWHRDPITGKRWPRRFWTDYDPVRECSAGDPKTIHEINRHAHLPRLSKAYFLTGNERYAHDAVCQLSGWIDQNPPSLGINWQSSLEIALRCISWIWSLFFLLPSRALDEESASRIGRSLFAQLEHVFRYPSIYSSPNTHLLGEATALFVAGVLFREHKRSHAWLRQGSALLIEQLKRQTTAEGVHVELSTYYHCYTVDFYLQALILAQRNSVPVPAFVWLKLSQMIDFLGHVTAPDGSIPRIGDDDGGRALSLRTDSYASFRDAFSTAAVLWGRADFKDLSGGFCEETLWLLGENAANLYSRLQARGGGWRSAGFASAGYFVQRSGAGDRADRLILDCGGLGKPSGGHGHADALSIALAVGGRELLVDPGTYIYNTSPQWRDYFRSTRAHNTVVIDGRDQSEPGGTFGWKSAARVHAIRHLEFAEGGYVEGEHDGYARLPHPVVHRRRVLHTGNYWAVADDFRGRGEHTFDINFHFAADAGIRAVQPESARDALEVLCERGGEGLGMFLCASSPLRAEIASGQERPLQGWVSRRYGHRQAAPVLTARMNAATPASALTFLFPFDASQPRGVAALPAARRIPTAPGVLACEVRLGDLQDILLFTPGSTAATTLCGLTALGEFFWLRQRGGRLVRAIAVEARILVHSGDRLLDARDPQTFHFTAEADSPVPPQTSEGQHTCAESVDL